MFEHTTGNCVGNWRLAGSSRSGTSIICTHCTASHSSTPENRLAAIDENYAGIYLRRLTTEGARLLQ